MKTILGGTRLLCLSTLLSGVLGIAWTSPAAESKNSDCLECHSDRTLTATNSDGAVKVLYIDETNLLASVHKTNTCAACHNDLKPSHPDGTKAARVDCARCHERLSRSYSESVHAAAKRAHNEAAPDCADCHGTHGILPATAPESPLYFTNLSKTCGQCHTEEAAAVSQSVHGKAVAQGKRGAATCIDCHSEHRIEGLKNRDALAISRDVCSKCHASERMNTRFNLPSDRVKTFFESYHGLAAQKGSTTAANCSSCHGVHRILPSTDPESTINKNHLVATCGKCHAGATANFAQAKVHVDLTYGNGRSDIGQRVNWWVRKVYLTLIFSLISAMLFHNGLSFARKAAARARLENRSVQRMDFSQRLQHATLALSFIVLAWSGFALKFPDSWIGGFIMANELVRGWSHRIAGVVLLAVGVYHVGYLIGAREGRRLAKDMMPCSRDLSDATGTVSYLLGLKSQKPGLARFGYAEKLEYWAVVWGTIIMGFTGLVIWLQIPVTRFLPRWVVEVATNIHYYEAILACLAILVWHLYHVILDPDIYPLNRACLDGHVTPEWQHKEHPLETIASEPGTKETTSKPDKTGSPPT